MKKQAWLGCAVLSGALLPFAFAPFFFSSLATLALMLFLRLIENTDPRTAAQRGFAFGFGCFLVGVSWVYISIHVYGNTPSFVAAGVTLLFVSILSVFPALNAYLLQRFFKENSALKYYVIFPSSWALLEWLRGTIFSGFPWLIVSHSQVPFSSLSGFFPLIGQWGVSFLIAFISALIFNSVFVKKPNRFKQCLPVIVVCVLYIVGGLLQHILWTQAFEKPQSIALVQGNIPQEIKWDPNVAQQTLRTYKNLTDEHWNADLIFWPEAALPMLPQQAMDFLFLLSAKAKLHNTHLIIGAPMMQEKLFYNGLFTLGPGVSQHYYKRHLVPFGEYVPLDFLLRGLIGFFNVPMSNFTPGEKQAPLHLHNIAIGNFICYEIAYPSIVHDIASASNLLVVSSNDGWFGESWASAQHLQIAQVQALQTQKPLLFISNTGITATVDFQGHITKSIPPFKEGVLTNTVQARSGNTPWSYYGDAPILGLLLLLLLGAYIKRKT